MQNTAQIAYILILANRESKPYLLQTTQPILQTFETTQAKPRTLQTKESGSYPFQARESPDQGLSK